MKRLTAIILVSAMVFSFCACKKEKETVASDLYYKVRFMTNRSGENVVLSSGFTAEGENVMFASSEVKAGEKAERPSSEPSLSGYDFDGWTTVKNGYDEYDFNSAVNFNLTLYARWRRSAASAETDDFTEPEIEFTEKTDANVNGIEVYSVCNQSVENGNVKLTALAIRLLSEASDVKTMLGYAVNPSATIFSATYNAGKIAVEYEYNGNQRLEITVTDITESLAVASNYETKAEKYEQTSALKRKGVVMAGSLSMENWATSKEDMAPLSTVNVGIGGTVAEQWTESLAQRLIYPFDPRAVVLYVGVNNIVNAGKTGAQTGEALTLLFDDIRSHLPEATVYFILINDIPLVYQSDRVGQKEEIAIANGIVRDYAEGKDWLVLVDAGEGLIKESGKPNSAYFLTDGLHMSLCGYAIWGAKVREAVIAKERILFG